MEILKFLLIVALIAFFIVRQARKNKAEQAENSPSAPAPGNFNPTERPQVKERKMAKPPLQASGQAKKAKNHYTPSVSEGARTTDATPTPPETEQPADTDFAIRSAEDARKAIVWSEILNRKY